MPAVEKRFADAKATGQSEVSVVYADEVPGYPRRRVRTGLIPFMTQDLCTFDLDRLAPRLWLMSTPSHTNVTPLHRQRLRGREVVVMEDPGLHLVWHHRVIYVKPLPKYLLDQSFRDQLLQNTVPGSREFAISAAIYGFLRTYALLIQHESDFRLAQSDALQLIPRTMDWDGFNRFISEFEDVDPALVSPRYQSYGELRFSRLNALVKIFLFKWHYRYTDGRYKDYLENFYAPLLFLFAIVSVVLNAMQVTLAVGTTTGSDWQGFTTSSHRFASFTIAVTIALVAVLVLLLLRKIMVEVGFALRTQIRSHFEGTRRVVGSDERGSDCDVSSYKNGKETHRGIGTES